MTKDNGLGKVVSKNNLFISDSLTDHLTAVRHANGRDWWVLNLRYGSNKIYKLLITPYGIQGPYSQNIGSLKNAVWGQMTFSRNGDLLAIACTGGIVDLFDFDRCTGMLSEWKDLGEHLGGVDGYSYFGSAFAPNGKVLYVSSSLLTDLQGLKVYQYDLNASDIKASKKIIWTYNETADIDIGMLMLGPDNRIYLANYAYPPANPIYPYYPNGFYNKYNQNLSIINNPDVVGSGCDFQPYSFYLGGKRSYIGLPNMPNYNLGGIAGSPCDSITAVVSPKSKVVSEIQVYPNPNNGKMRFEYSIVEDSELSIYNILGEEITSIMLDKHQHSFEVNLLLSAGTYYYSLSNHQTVKTEKFVVVK